MAIPENAERQRTGASFVRLPLLVLEHLESLCFMVTHWNGEHLSLRSPWMLAPRTIYCLFMT